MSVVSVHLCYYILVWYVQTVFPALHYGADNLQIVSEYRPFFMETVFHKKLHETIGENFISSVTLEIKREKGDHIKQNSSQKNNLKVKSTAYVIPKECIRFMTSLTSTHSCNYSNSQSHGKRAAATGLADCG